MQKQFLIFFLLTHIFVCKGMINLDEQKSLEKLKKNLKQSIENDPGIRTLHKEIKDLSQKRKNELQTIRKNAGIEQLETDIADAITELQNAQQQKNRNKITKHKNKIKQLHTTLKKKEKSVEGQMQAKIFPIDQQIRTKTIALRKKEQQSPDIQQLHTKIGAAEEKIIKSVK